MDGEITDKVILFNKIVITFLAVLVIGMLGIAASL